ncbi:MAG: ABC transporter permease [Pseudomonadota bacterium]
MLTRFEERLTPLTRRRLANFRANRRGYRSLQIFLCLLVLSLFAELIANDRPLVMSYDGSLYFPVVFEYFETEFDGDFEVEAEYRDPYVQGLIEENGWMLWPPLPYRYDTIDTHIPQAAPSPPSLRHPLGTDDVGRDVLARIIYGFRLSVLFGLALTLISAVIGVSVGAVQGYFGGIIDLLGQRLVEIWAGLPVLFLLIILSSLVEPGALTLLGLLLLFQWLALVAVVRAEFLRTRNFDYVRASRALGASDLAIIRQDVLPNAMVATLTFVPFLLNGSITVLTSLDFLGFGLPAGSPSLGELLAQGKANLHAPWLGLSGFFTLLVMLSLLIFIGEAVRDAFDPRRSTAAVQRVGI